MPDYPPSASPDDKGVSAAPWPKTLVLVLNWDGEEDTIEAVGSALNLDYPLFDLLVLDNGSRPASREAIRAAWPDVELVETGGNLGYAGGNNVGLRLGLERGAEFCLVLNNDLVVEPSMLQRLVAEAMADPSLAVLGPGVYRYDRREALFYEGWEIDWRRWLFRRAPRPDEDKAIVDVDFVQGCALLLRSRFLREQGLFDERFHIYCEDADLCVRARQAGYRTVEVSGARAWHKGSRATGRLFALKTYYGLRNRLLFIDLHAPRRNRATLRAQLLVFDAGGQAIGAAREMIRGNFRRGLRTLRALGRALLDWLRGRYGPGPEWLFRDEKPEERE